MRLGRLMAILAVFSLVAAACAQDEPQATGPTGAPLPGADFHGCYVTDTGGVDDRSFNQLIHEGMLRAETELGIQYDFVESQGAADYAPNLEAFVGQDCDLIVPAGFNLGTGTVASAEANPDQLYTIVDYNISDPKTFEDLTFDNIQELTFQTDEAAFLAGYLSAGMTKSGTVATYGGVLFPTVTIFMNGFAAGIRHHNAEKGTDVQLLGWDPDAGDAGEGTQVSPDPAVGFDNSAEGRRITEDFIADGADIILPVAGPTGLGTIAAAEDAGDVSVIWVDIDGCVSVPDSCGLFLTSIEKHMDLAVFQSMQSVIDGTFESGLYVGTLANDGVGISEFHEFDSAVPQELKDELDVLKQGIIDGTVSVNPRDYAA